MIIHHRLIVVHIAEYVRWDILLLELLHYVLTVLWLLRIFLKIATVLTTLKGALELPSLEIEACLPARLADDVLTTGDYNRLAGLQVEVLLAFFTDERGIHIY
jgi:hypothetical protein